MAGLFQTSPSKGSLAKLNSQRVSGKRDESANHLDWTSSKRSLHWRGEDCGRLTDLLATLRSLTLAALLPM